MIRTSTSHSNPPTLQQVSMDRIVEGKRKLDVSSTAVPVASSVHVSQILAASTPSSVLNHDSKSTFVLPARIESSSRNGQIVGIPIAELIGPAAPRRPEFKPNNRLNSHTITMKTSQVFGVGQNCGVKLDRNLNNTVSANSNLSVVPPTDGVNNLAKPLSHLNVIATSLPKTTVVSVSIKYNIYG